MVIHVSDVRVDVYTALYEVTVDVHYDGLAEELKIRVPAYLVRTIEEAEQVVTKIVTNIMAQQLPRPAAVWPYVNMQGATWRVDTTEV